jgi:hypothetical protein
MTRTKPTSTPASTSTSENQKIYMSGYDKTIEPRIDSIEQKITEMGERIEKLIKALEEKFPLNI